MSVKQYFLFVDNDKYEWSDPTISGAQLRALAGVPEGVQVFQHRPGQPDLLIHDGDNVDLSIKPSPERFSTQSAGSQAG